MESQKSRETGRKRQTSIYGYLLKWSQKPQLSQSESWKQELQGFPYGCRGPNSWVFIIQLLFFRLIYLSSIYLSNHILLHLSLFLPISHLYFYHHYTPVFHPCFYPSITHPFSKLSSFCNTFINYFYY